MDLKSATQFIIDNATDGQISQIATLFSWENGYRKGIKPYGENTVWTSARKNIIRDLEE